MGAHANLNVCWRPAHLCNNNEPAHAIFVLIISHIHSLNVLATVNVGLEAFDFGPSIHSHLYFVYASNVGSDETERMRRLV